MDLIVDNELKNLVPMQKPSEHEGLEQNLLKYGFNKSYPIITWNRKIVDGHNRYELCKKHNIEFVVSEQAFSDKSEVINWMIDNQLNRRNITEDQRAYLIGKRYHEEKKAFGDNQYSSDDNRVDHCELPKNTADKIAKKTNVGQATVKRDEKFAEAVDKVAENTGLHPQKILSGDIKTTRKDIQTVSKLSPEVQRIVFKKIENKEVKTVKEAIKETKKDESDKISEVENIEPEVIKMECAQGNFYKLGTHLLYCGSNLDECFRDELDKLKIDFVFADPPYNAGTGETWDSGFKWEHDWLMDVAEVVAVTPGIVSIHEFMNNTKMHYAWSVSCWISNGMTRGAMGFGNWIYTSIFSKGSIYKNSQDFLKVSINTSENGETKHKGRKPSNLIMWLFEKFCKKGSWVCDPFLGSGTSLLVAEKMNIKCIGSELSEDYCTEIISRWERLTGGQAELYENYIRN